MNQLLGVKNNTQKQSQSQVKEHGIISLHIRVYYEQGQSSIQLNLDASAPFHILVQVIKENVIAQNMSNQFEESIKYSFLGVELDPNESRSLRQIGILNQSTIDVKLNYKGSSMSSSKIRVIEFEFEDEPQLLKLNFKFEEQEQPFLITIEDNKTADELFQRIKKIISPFESKTIFEFKVNGKRGEQVRQKTLRELGYKDGMEIRLNHKEL